MQPAATKIERKLFQEAQKELPIQITGATTLCDMDAGPLGEL
jgi:hypothetical protein